MSAKRPIVSVIVPVYNSEDTLKDTLKSATSQSYTNLEILVCDDASKDDSYQVLKELAELDERITVFVNRNNLGAGKTRDRLLKHVRGEFIAFLDSDDVWYPNKISNQINYMTKYGIDVCASDYHIINEEKNFKIYRSVPKKVSFFKMHFANWVPMSMTIVRSNLLGTNTMPSIRRRQDYCYWLSIFRLNPNIKYAKINESLGAYLVQKNGLSSSALSNIKYNYLVFRSYLRYSRLLSFLCLSLNIVTRITRPLLTDTRIK